MSSRHAPTGGNGHSKTTEKKKNLITGNKWYKINPLWMNARCWGLLFSSHFLTYGCRFDTFKNEREK